MMFGMDLTSAEGIPEIYYLDTCRGHRALVMELLGPSLESLLQKCRGKFTVKTTAMIAIQLVSILHFSSLKARVAYASPLGHIVRPSSQNYIRTVKDRFFLSTLPI